MTTSFTQKLIALGILSMAMFAGTLPAEAKWIINRAGDIVLVRSQVLGLESTGVPAIDGIYMDDESMQRASDEMMNELEKASQLSSLDTGGDQKTEPEKSLRDIGPVPDKFKHIEKSDIKQIRIAPTDAFQRSYEGGKLTPVGGMGQTEPERPDIKKPGVAIEVKTDADKLIIHQDTLEIEKKGGNVTIGPSSDKSTMLEMRRNQFSVKIPFPVKIDPTTQELQVESPSGDLPLRVMPEQAKVILETKSKLTLEDTTEPVPEVVDGKLSYTYKGQQVRKMFGFIPVSLAKIVHVSAEDGTIVEEPQVGIWNRMKNWLSR